MSRALVFVLAVPFVVLSAREAVAQDVVAKTKSRLAEPAGAPITRLALGPAFHLSPKADEGTRLGLDATVGANVAVNGWGDSGPIFSLEAGYAYDSLGLHAAQFSPGIGYGHPILYLTYNPRLLVGSAGDGLALGMRNSLTTHLVADLLSVEIGHQYVRDDRASQQSVRLMLGVNPAAAVYAISRLW